MFRMFFFLHHRWWSDFPDSDLSASWKLKIYKLLFSKCRVDKIIEEWTIESDWNFDEKILIKKSHRLISKFPRQVIFHGAESYLQNHCSKLREGIH